MIALFGLWMGWLLGVAGAAPSSDPAAGSASAADATAATVASCDDLPALELRAMRARLPDDVEQCLERRLVKGDADERAKASFALILSAYSGKALDLYGERMQRHLQTYHTTDAEVAYLYARYLWKRSGDTGDPPYTDQILRWSRVAMDGRTRWLHNRRNYDEMVRNLYDMLVQTSLQAALRQQRAYTDTPNDDNRLAADQAQRRARHYLIVAAPCLHRGECGPTFEVIVEGLRECDELGPLEDYAAGGRLDDGHRSCLRARYRRPGSPKRRILDILITDAANHDAPDRFEFLMAWHWNVTERDDPEMAYRFASWLADNDGNAELLAQWSEAALATSKMNDARSTQLYEWRVRGWQGAVDLAAASDAAQSTERTRRDLAHAQTRLADAKAARDAFCAENGCRTPSGSSP